MLPEEISVQVVESPFGITGARRTLPKLKNARVKSKG